MLKKFQLTKYFQILLKKFVKLIIYILILPIVIILVLIKPVIHLRFASLDNSRFGPLLGKTRSYIREKIKNKKYTKVIDIMGYPSHSANQQIEKMASRVFKVYKGAFFWGMIEKATFFWLRKKTFCVPSAVVLKDTNKILSEEPFLQFTDEEIKLGNELLLKLGVPKGSSWICIHNRDSEYHNKFSNLNPIYKNFDWSYHSYRDFSPQTMVLAAEEFVKHGYYVVRMGKVVKEKLKSNNEKIIDYSSTSLRSDFFDVFLLANCKAYFGSNAGISSCPKIFVKPVYYVNENLSQLSHLSLVHSGLFITKHIYDPKNKKYISLREMYECGLYKAATTQHFKDKGFEIISNSAEELKDLAIEVKHEFDKKNYIDDADTERQKKFWDLFKYYTPKKDYDEINLNIGYTFLRKNPYLLN